MLKRSWEFFIEKYFHIAPTKQSAMEKMIRSVRVDIPKNYSKINEIHKLENDFKKEIFRLRHFFIINAVFYVIAYANIIFFMFSYHKYVQELIGIMSSLASAIGTPILIFAIFFMHYLIGVVYQKLNMTATRLVVLYEEVRNLKASKKRINKKTDNKKNKISKKK